MVACFYPGLYCGYCGAALTAVLTFTSTSTTDSGFQHRCYDTSSYVSSNNYLCRPTFDKKAFLRSQNDLESRIGRNPRHSWGYKHRRATLICKLYSEKRSYIVRGQYRGLSSKDNRKRRRDSWSI